MESTEEKMSIHSSRQYDILETIKQQAVTVGSTEESKFLSGQYGDMEKTAEKKKTLQSFVNTCELHKQLDKSVHETKQLKIAVNDVEQYSWRKNIEIHGVPFKENEDIFSVLASVSQKIVLPPPYSKKVEAAHRLKAKEGKIPVILVRFDDRNVRKSWATKRDALKLEDICINDNLTRRVRQLWCPFALYWLHCTLQPSSVAGWPNPDLCFNILPNTYKLGSAQKDFTSCSEFSSMTSRDQVGSDVADKLSSIRLPTLPQQDGAGYRAASDHSPAALGHTSHSSCLPDKSGGGEPELFTTASDTSSLVAPVCPQEKTAGLRNLGSHTAGIQKPTRDLCGFPGGAGASLLQSPAVPSETLLMDLETPQQEQKTSQYSTNSNDSSIKKPFSDVQGLPKENDLPENLAGACGLSLELPGPSANDIQGVVKPDIDELDFQAVQTRWRNDLNA
ncbi:hypothetical protein V5799_020624 [Amblyomma americanum]|uniref:Uncharacterized protein n=1 Tax=Amblyomma americanum TaxID=6943 RepID=A0AAQ4ETS9_AMBAM